MQSYIKGVSALNLTWMNQDIATHFHGIPAVVLLMILAVLVIVLTGIITRIAAVVQGKGNLGDLLFIAIILLFLFLFAALFFKVSVRGFILE